MKQAMRERSYFIFWNETMPDYLDKLGFRKETVNILIAIGRGQQLLRWAKGDFWQ